MWYVKEGYNRVLCGVVLGVWGVLSFYRVFSGGTYELVVGLCLYDIGMEWAMGWRAVGSVW